MLFSPGMQPQAGFGGIAPMQLSVLDPSPHEPLPKPKSCPVAASRIDRPGSATACPSVVVKVSRVKTSTAFHQLLSTLSGVGSSLDYSACNHCGILVWDGPRPWAMGPCSPPRFHMLSHALPSARPWTGVYARLTLQLGPPPDTRPGPA